MLVQAALAGHPVAWCSPTYRMLTEVGRTLTTLLQPVTRQRTQHRLELVTGGVVELWSLHQPDRLRGRRYGRVVVDEAAMVADLRGVWQQVLRPTLADLRGDGWLLSTPRGHDFFYDCYVRGQHATSREWRSWQLPTSANPLIAPAELTAAQHDLPPHVYHQEFAAQFLAAGGSVFGDVRAVATAAAQDTAHTGHAYVCGVDWGRHNDATVFAVVDTTLGALVRLERLQQVPFAQQLARLHALAARFTPGVIVAEQNSIGQPLIEQLQRAGLPVQPFVTSSASKLHLIDALALALSDGSLSLLPDDVLLDELTQFTHTRLPSGLVRYAAPPGAHDDTVMALALAWWAARDYQPLLLWS